jgi:hypothetical protein
MTNVRSLAEVWQPEKPSHNIEALEARARIVEAISKLPDGALVGVSEAAAWLDHHEVTIRRMVYDGIIKIPKRKRGTRIKIRMGELRRLTGEQR